MRYMLRKVVALGLLGFSGVAYSGMSESHLFRIPTEPLVTQLIVKLQPTVGAANGRVMTQSAMNRLTAASGLPLSYKRQMSGGAHVLKLPFPMPMWQAQEYASSLQQQGDVEFAEPDGWAYPLAAVMPNDPDYAAWQWHLQDPADGNAGAANLPLAWGETQGSSNIVVSVVDTGVLNHTELSSRLVGGSAAASGYDFISGDLATANDGDFRDGDPSDPGDGDENFLCSWEGDHSSWHGTHVAGTIGAASNNNVGMTGVDWNAKLLTARVLGVCGGRRSDIIDGIAWSSGESVPGVPANANPAKVINLSLGGPGSCSVAAQTAINAAVARGSVVVVAAGNEDVDAERGFPANCNQVVTVAALDRAGSKAYFSNFGSVVDIAAPGVSIYSTLDTGKYDPDNSNTFEIYRGTSMAAPHTSGVVSLMLAAQPNLTNGTVPTASVASVIESNLKASARAFPAGSTCTTARCGAGMLDAYRAVMAVKTPPVANAGVNQTVAMGSAVNLNGTSSANNGYGTAALSSYTWIQTAGSPVVLTGANTATPSFTAPNVAGQTLTFQLTVKNDVGLTHSATVDVQIPASDSGSSGGGGGGSFPLGWSSLLLIAGLLLKRYRQFSV